MLLIVNSFFSSAEHKIPLDVDKMNRECLELDQNLWDALENSKWSPVELMTTYTCN